MNRCRLRAYPLVMVLLLGGVVSGQGSGPELQGTQTPAGPPALPQGTGGGAYRPSSGITNPSVVTRVDPVYTLDAAERRIQGEVWVECIVNISGECVDIRVTKSLDAQYGLDQEAVKAVQGWRFRPGTKGGQPVPVMVTIAIEFTIRRSSYTRTTVTVQAIDAAARTLTVDLGNGEVDDFDVAPEVVRFNELKAGDRVRVMYIESVVLEVRKPGDVSTPAADAPGSQAGTTAKPPDADGGRRQTATVTVLNVDQAASSLTVQTADGRTVTRKVNDRNAIANVRAGDRIDVTYSQALVTSAEPSK